MTIFKLKKANYFWPPIPKQKKNICPHVFSQECPWWPYLTVAPNCSQPKYPPTCGTDRKMHCKTTGILSDYRKQQANNKSPAHQATLRTEESFLERSHTPKNTVEWFSLQEIPRLGITAMTEGTAVALAWDTVVLKGTRGDYIE